MAETVATYSICACDLAAGQWGVATQSKFLAVGSVVPWASPHVGAIATQSYANPRYGPDGLALLREGLSGREVVERLTAADEDRALRQLGVVDGEGRAATFTGDGCHAWAGGRTGDGYAAQGNILVSDDDRRRARGDVRGDGRSARSRSGCSTASTPRRRRVATAAAASRRRCSSSSGTAATRGSPTRSSTCASTTTRPARRAAPNLPAPRRALRLDAARGVDPRRRRAARQSSTSTSRASGTTTSPPGQESRISRSASTARRQIDPVVLAATAGGDMSERYGVDDPRRARDAARYPARRSGTRSARTLGVSAFGINAWTATEDGRPDRSASTTRRAARPRGAVHRAHRPRDVHARRRGGRRPGGDARARSRPRGQARGRRRGGHDHPRRRREAGRGVHPVRVGAVGRGAPVLADGGMGQGDRGARRASRGDSRPRWNALQPRVRSRAGGPRRTWRSDISGRPSSSRTASPSTRRRTTTSSRSAISSEHARASSGAVIVRFDPC